MMRLLVHVSLLSLCRAGSWQLVAEHKGEDVFDSSSGFDFVVQWRAGDGQQYVNWVSKAEAEKLDLFGVNDDGQAYIRGDNVTGDLKPYQGRKAVALKSNASYEEGLFVLDATHMPSGCGAHYAWWLVGPDWPKNGEIDIAECINDDVQARTTLHTNGSCDMDGDERPAFSGDWVDNNRACNVTGKSNNGCEIVSSNTASCGSAFNQLGSGGVFVTELKKQGQQQYIKSWFFSRSQVPSDLTNNQPTPDSWRVPDAMFPLGRLCDSSHFQQLRMTLSINFCGWAGTPLQWDKSCAALTGSATCIDWIAKNPAAVTDMRFDVNFISVFQWTGESAVPDVQPDHPFNPGKVFI